MALLDRVPDSTSAAAPGWQAVEIPGEVFPALIPADSTAEGTLLHGLTPAEWRLIDAFEDPFYELRRLTLTDGHHGWAYVCPDPDTVSERPWSAETFATQHLDAYVENCTAWRKDYGSQC